jgi:hypothetical protein
MNVWEDSEVPVTGTGEKEDQEGMDLDDFISKIRKKIGSSYHNFSV